MAKVKQSIFAALPSNHAVLLPIVLTHVLVPNYGICIYGTQVTRVALINIKDYMYTSVPACIERPVFIFWGYLYLNTVSLWFISVNNVRRYVRLSQMVLLDTQYSFNALKYDNSLENTFFKQNK